MLAHGLLLTSLLLSPSSRRPSTARALRPPHRDGQAGRGQQLLHREQDRDLRRVSDAPLQHSLDKEERLLSKTQVFLKIFMCFIFLILLCLAFVLSFHVFKFILEYS